MLRGWVVVREGGVGVMPVIGLREVELWCPRAGGGMWWVREGVNVALVVVHLVMELFVVGQAVRVVGL